MKTNLSIKAFTLVAVFGGLLSPIQIAQAANNPSLPTFSDFVAKVINGHADMVTGVYVPSLFAFPVVAQPANNPGYVSSEDGVITRFGMAAENVVGLLAHNNLAGAWFSNLFVGQEIRVVYGDGHFITYWIDRISSFQALQPNDMNSQFYDFGAKHTYTANEIFNMFYTGSDHVVFQTCIAKGGEASWGRLFVSAVPNRYATVLPSDVMNILFKAWPSLLEVHN